MSDLLDARIGKNHAKLAVLIDAENISNSIVQGLFDEIAKLEPIQHYMWVLEEDWCNGSQMTVLVILIQYPSH